MSRKKISSGSQNPKIRYTEETAQTLAITGFEPILLPNLRLYTIRMFDVSIFLTDERSEKVKISIDKMNRIFYLLEGKMFSMQFPFCIDDSSNQDNAPEFRSLI